MLELPTTYAVIPAVVRYDLALPPAARLLYGEITALCAQRGYCWATNDYFARLYQVRRATVSGWIQQLIERGHLVSSIDQARGNRRQLRPAPEDAAPSSDFPHPLAPDTAPPIPPGRTTFPEIYFAEGPTLLLGEKNDIIEGEEMATLALEPKKKSRPDPNGAAPPPIPPVARPPLPSPAGHLVPVAPQPPTGASLFRRPEPAEVAAYFATLPNAPAEVAAAEAARFFNYYQANGWRVGRHDMADWPAAARNWLLNADRFKTPAAGASAAAATRLHSGGSKNYNEPL